jgi:hypothetical protein
MSNRFFACAAAAVLSACAHSKSESKAIGVEVRGTTSGRGRSFDFDPSRGELVAWGTNGRLLQLWAHASELMIGAGIRREVPEGCRAGFLTRHDSEGSVVQITIQLCPQAGAPEGWQGWHADFELHANTDVAGTLPPKTDFAVGWDGELHELRIASRVLRASMAVANDAAPVRSYPEMFAFAVVIGVVPVAPDGKYQAD